MTGKGWRLLAVLPLFLSATLFAQDPLLITHEPVGSSYFESPRLSPLVSPISAPQPIRPPFRDPINPRPVTLRQVTRAAGIIFSGQVVSVAREEGPVPQVLAPNAVPISITFQVEDGILNASTGQRLTIHEWAGLWANGERYRAGERVFLFLYPPSRLGLTSPISGHIGRFAIGGGRRVHLGIQHIPVFAADPTLGGRNVIPYMNFVKAVKESMVEK
jgi:hypothetical protein